MKIVIKDDIVIAIHEDHHDIQGLYPDADSIKRIINSAYVSIGEPDPTLTFPGIEIVVKIFIHTAEEICIINDVEEFSCPPDTFLSLVPSYPGLPTGMKSRYWSLENKYVSDGVSNFPDTLDCLPYIDNINTYTQALPLVYAHVSLSKNTLCSNADPSDAITFQAHLKATQNPADPDLPIDYSWLMPLRHETQGILDRFLADFSQGSCSSTYIFIPGLPHGTWRLDENDFTLVNIGGQDHKVSLVNPVEFTVYRELP